MVERRGHAQVATFFAADEPLVVGGTLTLGEAAARHAAARRLGPGATARLVDGHGGIALGTVLRSGKGVLNIEVTERLEVPAPPAVHLLVPIADRDRMLWLAEKATEFGVTSWRPVLWRRSRSVKPKGEGTIFNQKVRARMMSALEQSGGAWLPAIYPEAAPERALGGLPPSERFVADLEGGERVPPILPGPIVVAVGPEGGLEEGERKLLLENGFRSIALADSILRFETAALALVALARQSTLSRG